MARWSAVPEPGGRADAALRVLHVSHTARPGGAELALRRLLAASPPWCAALAAPPAPPMEDAFVGLAERGVAIDRGLPTLPTGGTRHRDPLLVARYVRGLAASAWALRRSPVRAGTDVVHANTAAAAIAYALADPLATAPLVVHCRDLITVEALGPLGLRAFTGLALRRAAGIIANSRATLESTSDRLPAGLPSAVIHSPLGLARRVTRPRVAPEVRVVGMVARLQRWKGQHVFLRAFAEALRGTRVRAQLAGAPLFGQEEYERELRVLAADLGIADQVSFLGQVEDVSAFLSSVDLLVHASVRAEPLGQSVLQGLAHAVPVIATDGGGPAEWVRPGVNGLLVPPDDSAALAAALRRVVGSVELRARLAEGAARTPGILTDAECATAHGGLLRAVWAAQAGRKRGSSRGR
jgi:glycosyltransferase involved in cell wall biosynthesis